MSAISIKNLPRALVKEPSKAVSRLRSLFSATRGSVIRPDEELARAVSSLSTSLCVEELGLNEGRMYTGGLKIGDGLWHAMITNDLLFLLLEMIKDDSFVIQAPVCFDFWLSLYEASANSSRRHGYWMF